jgi:Uma2 family endonuclease
MASPITASPRVIPASPPASEVRQVLLGTLAGRLYVATQTQAPRSLRLSATMADPTQPNQVLTADLVVASGPAVSGRTLVAEPVVVVEVLNRSSEAAVRQFKLPAFRALPGCREVVLIGDDRVYAEVHRLLPGGRWITDLLLDPDARLHLDVAGLDLPLGILYAQTGLVRR